MAKATKNQQIWFSALKLILFLGVIFVFRQQIIKAGIDLKEVKVRSVGALLLTFFLVPLNWWLEYLKWKVTLDAADKALKNKEGPEVVGDLRNEAAGYMQVAQSLRQQQAALSEKYSAHAQQVRLIKEQQAAEDAAAARKQQIDQSVISSLRATNYQYIELTKGAEAARRAQLTDQGVGEADQKRILFAEESLKKEKELADAKAKAQEQEKQRLEKIDDIRKTELQRLEEQRIAMEQGEEAAHSYRLQQQGLDKATANAIAAAQAQADAVMKAGEQKQMQAAPDVAAKESRLLIRGKQDDSQKKIEQNTAQTVGKLDKVKEAIDGLKNSLQTGPGITFSGTGP